MTNNPKEIERCLRSVASSQHVYLLKPNVDGKADVWKHFSLGKDMTAVQAKGFQATLKLRNLLRIKDHLHHIRYRQYRYTSEGMLNK